MIKLKMENNVSFFPEITYECCKCRTITQFYTIPPAECVGCGLRLPDLRRLVEERAVRQNYHKFCGIG